MDLAVVHPFLYVRGGAEKVVLKVAQHFDAKVYCVVYEPDNTFPEFKDVDVQVLRTKVLRMVPGFFERRLREAIISAYTFYNAKLGDYDVINAQGTPSEWIRNKNSPVVWYVHSPNREAFDLYDYRMRQKNMVQRMLYWASIKPYRTIEPKIVPRIEHIFANSRNTQGRLKRYLGVDSEVLNPCVDYERFYCGDYQKYFLYPSRIIPEKRFEFAIKAFKEFKKKNPGWKLVITGSLIRSRKNHVEYYQRIKEMLGDDGDILLDVSDEKLRELYSNCYSVLYTPIDEDFGIVPLEGFASYKPCIAVNEGGPREVVVDGKTGYLVNSEDEMTRRMNTLAGDRNLTEKMGRDARRHVEKNYSWNRFMEKFEDVCSKLKSN